MMSFIYDWWALRQRRWATFLISSYFFFDLDVFLDLFWAKRRFFFLINFCVLGFIQGRKFLVDEMVFIGTFLFIMSRRWLLM